MSSAIEIVQHLIRQGVGKQIPVVSKVPTQHPEVFIRVDQAAPVVLSPVHERTRVIVQVYGLNRYETYALARLCRDVLQAGEGRHRSIYGVEEMRGPEEMLDPDLPEVSRWQIHGIIYTAS